MAVTDQTHDVDSLLEAFDHHRDHDEVDPAIIKCMAFIKHNTGLLGDYNDGRANINVSASTVMVTARTGRFRNPLVEWLNEQEDLRIAHICVKYRNTDPRPHIEIKAD